MPARLADGSTLLHYRILGFLGRGGMGEVYKARDPRLERDVAIKLLDADSLDSPDRRARFEQEARAASALNHPNILTIYDIGDFDGRPYFVSEFIDGETLHALIQRGSLVPRKLLDIAVQIADGLSAAHEAGITHRDMKPENVMLTKEGRVKILDFGLAKMPLPGDQDATLKFGAPRSIPGLIMGTIAYMSPEQARGLGLDYRTDQFSLGLVIHEMATGSQTFRRETPAETMTAIIREDAQTLGANVPAPLRWIVARLLSKEPEERYIATKDLFRELRALKEHLSESTTTTTVEAAPEVPKRSVSKWRVTAVVAVIGIAAGAMGMLRMIGGIPFQDELRHTPIASEQGMESAPLFSPDGKAFAYVMNNRELLVRTFDSDVPLRLTTLVNSGGVGHVWSVDSNQIYFNQGGDLFRVAASGGAPSLVLQGVGRVVLTPDGKTLLFIRREKGKPVLMTSSPPGAEPKPAPVQPAGADQFSLASISPDGSKLAFTQTFTPVRDFGWMVLSYPEMKPVTKRNAGRLHGWFPDSRHLLVQKGIAGYRFSMVSLDGGAERILTTGPEVVISGHLSPEGKRLAYSTGFAHWDIAEYGLDGKMKGRVVASTRLETDPVWSPKGDRFLYSSNVLGTHDLWLRDSNGWNPRKLASAAISAGASFSPDGRRIVYSSKEQLWVMHTDGGRPVPVAGFKNTLGWVTWMPDGESILYAENGKLWKVPGNGGTPALFKDSAAQMGRQWTPDGKWLPCIIKGRISLISADGKDVRDFAATTVNGAFSADGKWYYELRAGATTTELVTREVPSGKEVKSVTMEFPQSERTLGGISLHPDGKRILLTLGEIRYDIWMIEGFAQPATGWRRLFGQWMPGDPGRAGLN
ncbi:MAG: serine/threonine-protein kinase [Candidatus Solibacter usitatus]|nr:serine/threonine-protein kinase [Candidatus Solibacter usitatus]